MIEYIYKLITISIPPETTRTVLSSLGFTNSIITFVLTNVMHRPSMVRWRRFCWITIVALWIGIMPCILDLICPVSIGLIQNAGIKIGVLIWTTGIINLMLLVYRLFAITLPAFTSEKLIDMVSWKHLTSFKISQEYQFGIPFMDDFLINWRKSKIKLYYPILVIADRTAPGLNFAQRFLTKGLEQEEGGSYLSFTRPWTIIANQIEDIIKESSQWVKNTVIVDCYSSLYLPKKKQKVSDRKYTSITVKYCDPRDPVEVNKVYKEALYILQKRGLNQVRSVYDSLSDFLAIADSELVVSYLRHSIVWEELFGVKALYLLWPEVLTEPLNDEYLAWFSNTTIWIHEEKQGYAVRVERVLPQPQDLVVTNNLEKMEELHESL